MSMLKVNNVTHWSIPVNNLEEAEHFYRNVLRLEYKGRLGNSNMACVTVAAHSILLCQRKDPLVRTPEQDNRLHHSFTVSPEMFDRACKLWLRSWHGSHPLLFLDDAKAYNCRKNNGLKYLSNYSEWPESGRRGGSRPKLFHAQGVRIAQPIV